MMATVHVIEEEDAPVVDVSVPSIRSAALKRLGRNLFSVLVSIVVILAVWVGFIRLYHIPTIVARTPLDIWRYLFTQKADKVHALRSASANRSVLWHYLKTTLRDAAIGYVFGSLLAFVVACLFVLASLIEQTLMPVALVLRSVPLIAMAPVLTLVFKRGVVVVAVIGGIVCFFPALVNIVYGLRSASRSSIDLMDSYGASRLTTLRKVLIPTAMPSIFASLRINVPAAVIGALLAEWLATGKGTGYEMLHVLNTFDYGELWAAVALVTLVSVIAYSAVSAVEAAVLSRYAPEVLGGKS
jgi:ABC-type nitrate/sulfonate/bicarbonate transport system permease component